MSLRLPGTAVSWRTVVASARHTNLPSQVCQFCFNNIKNNMNGLCPACRRPYDEKTIQWKVVTTEECVFVCC